MHLIQNHDSTTRPLALPVCACSSQAPGSCGRVGIYCGGVAPGYPNTVFIEFLGCTLARRVL
jgi:hypothetical protein